MNQFSRSIALWLVLGLMFLLLFNMFSRQQVKEPEIFSDFLNQVEKGQVSKVTIQGSTIHVVVNGEHYKTYAPADPDLVKTLRAKDIQIEAKPSEGDPWWMVLLVQWFPMLLLVGGVDFLHAPDADRRRQGHVFRQEPREAADREYP